MDSQNKKFDIDELLILLLENDLTDSQRDYLIEWSQTEPNAAKIYHEFLRSYSVICSEISARVEREYGTSVDTLFDNALWAVLAHDEKTAPVLEVPRKKPPRELVQKVVYPPREKREISKFQIFTFIASAAAILFLIAFPKIFPPKTNSIEIATLNAAVDVRWSDSTVSPKSGDALYSSESLSLVSGLVEIQTDNGVDLIVEGPAEFEFSKEGNLSLDYGKVCASVSAQGKGFTVTTATSKVVDLGTEFGVQADKSGNTEVHVYQGKVALLAGTKAMEKVTEFLLRGQARVVSSDGIVSERSVNEHIFVREDEMRAYIRAAEGSDYGRWLAYSYKLRRNPSLAAYYTFEKDENHPRQLENVAQMTSGRLEGHLADGDAGPQWVTGRWPQKDALRFNNEKLQYVKVDPDPALCLAGRVTIAAWIKCPDATKGGVVVSCRSKKRVNYQMAVFGEHIDSSEARPNTIHFYRRDDIKVPKHNFSKPWPEFPAGWTLVCVTHDNETVRYYINGQLYDTQGFKIQTTPELTEFMIGSYPASVLQVTPTIKNQVFNGMIDELMIFKSVLTAKEISNMYEAGKPDK